LVAEGELSHDRLAARGPDRRQAVKAGAFRATAARPRITGGGFRRDHLRALAQRVEVADREARIMGSKSELLRTLAAVSGEKSATPGVRSSV
jgi:hypothetical protein